MWALLFGVTFGLLASSRTGSAQVHSRSCSHAGVFHVEGSNRYSLTFEQAMELCESLGTVLADEEQIKEAHAKGLQTCRYGWISNRNTTILRHDPHIKCANNLTGIIFHIEKLDQAYDAYCFDASDTSDLNCDKLITPPETEEVAADEPGQEEDLGEEAATDAPVAVVPVAGGDGSEQPGDAADRDSADPEAPVEPAAAGEPSDPDPAHGTAAPAEDGGNEDDQAAPVAEVPEGSEEAPKEEGEAAPSQGPPAGEEPAEAGEQPAEGGEEPAEGGEQPAEGGEEPVEGGEEPAEGEQPAEGGEEPAEEGEQPAEGGEAPGEGEGHPDPTGVAPAEDLPTASGPPLGSGEERDHAPEATGEESEHPADHDNSLPANVPEPENNNLPGEVSVPGGRGRMNAEVAPTTEEQDAHGAPDWLIIVGVVAAIAIILLVCAAIATRNRWCGKQQTLMITSKEAGEGNGAAASSSRAQERDQEMVTLMNKEKIQENGNTEEFTVITLEESPDKAQLA